MKSKYCAAAVQPRPAKTIRQGRGQEEMPLGLELWTERRFKKAREAKIAD